MRRPKLSAEQVVALRAAYAPGNLKVIAATFGVSYVTAFNAIHSKRAYGPRIAAECVLIESASCDPLSGGV